MNYIDELKPISFLPESFLKELNEDKTYAGNKHTLNPYFSLNSGNISIADIVLPNLGASSETKSILEYKSRL